MRQSNWERRLTMTTRRRRGLDCGGGPVTDYRYGPYGPYGPTCKNNPRGC